MHISSSYAKIFGGKLFCTREISRIGSKAKNGEKKKNKEREKERLNDGDNNGQATHGARKHAWRTQAAWAKKHKNHCVGCAKDEVLKAHFCITVENLENPSNGKCFIKKRDKLF